MYLNACYHAMQHLSSSGGSIAVSAQSEWTLSTADRLVKDAALMCSLAHKG